MLTSSYPRFRGDNPGTFVQSLSEALAQRGHEIHVVAPYDPLVQPDPEAPVVMHRFRYVWSDDLCLVGHARSLEADVRLKRSVYPLTVLYLVAALKEIVRLNRRHHFDVIHANWVLPNGPIGAIAHRMTGVPLLIHLHGSDVFVSKYDSLGNPLWTRQMGTSSNDHSSSVVVDADGDIFISGSTRGSLGGPNAGSNDPFFSTYDAFVSKYDTSGGLLWTLQLGTSRHDYSTGVAVDAAGNVFISGDTEGSLGGTSENTGTDAFVVKYSIPEPATLLGDANLDNIVDLQDFSILKANFGQPGGWAEGNFNGDNLIDLQDFSILKANFGEHLPEPATLGLLLIGGVILSGRRK